MADQDYTQDPAFLKAKPEEQHAYLMAVDSGYAKSTPQQQAMYRNQILAPSRLAQSAKQTQFEKERIGATPASMAREGVLGFSSGLTGLPETQHPISDFGKQIKQQGENEVAHPLRTLGSLALGPAPQLYQLGKSLLESGGELGSGIIHLDPEKAMHGGGEVAGKLTQLAGLKEAPEATERPPITRNLLLDSSGQPNALPKLILGSDRARALGELLDPEAAAYQRKGMDLMRRGREQDILDRRAARDAATQEKAAATETKNAPFKGGVTVVPEPRAPFTGENEGYMASAPRGTLRGLAETGKPGAGTQIQQLGGKVIYKVPGAGIEPINMAKLRELAGTPMEASSGPLQPIDVTQKFPQEIPTGTANDRPQVKYKGGINVKGVEASSKSLPAEEQITGLSNQIADWNKELRTSGRTQNEKDALREQIDYYQKRLDELRAGKK